MSELCFFFSFLSYSSSLSYSSLLQEEEDEMMMMMMMKSLSEMLARPGRQLGVSDGRLGSGRGAGRRGRAPLHHGPWAAVGRVGEEEDEATVRVRQLRHELAEEVWHVLEILKLLKITKILKLPPTTLTQRHCHRIA